MTKGIRDKRARVPKMEGAMARWYARQRGTDSQIAMYRQQAAQLSTGLPDGADVLEVAPGPGYLSIELARLGRFHLTGLDISHSFVTIATDNARRAGVDVDFRHGNAEIMPFAPESFDLVVCQAAFKNFERPVDVLDEMHRVLRPGGTAVIHDLSRDVTSADIAREVTKMKATGINAFVIRMTLGVLRLRAASRSRFESLAAASAFRTCAITIDSITTEVRLTRPA
jgi:ubiquinone/menaquinone biosynthesis C-methylase UbiE